MATMLSLSSNSVLRSSIARPTVILRTAACTIIAPVALFSISFPSAGAHTSSPRSKPTTPLRPLRPALDTLPAKSNSPSLLRHQLRAVSSPGSTHHEIDAAMSASASPSQTVPSSATAASLNWDRFFALRKQRRRIQLFFSGLLSVGGVCAGGFLLFTSGHADALTAQIPLDPIMTMGLMTVACAALGWLAGPIIGSGVFNALNRKLARQMSFKESQFFARIRKHRVDPSASSMGNPVPDFYGEKISSVVGYRQWLKDQRAFNKKRTTFV